MNKINNNKHKTNKKNLLPNKKSYDLKHYSVQQLNQFAIKAYQSVDKLQQGGDRWNKMMAESGTKKDKVAAAGLMIIQNPQNSLKYFDMLVKWSFQENSNFAIKACQSLADIYIEHIFSEKSNLKAFTESIQQHIKSNKKNTSADEADLIGFYLQNQIKQYYQQLLKGLELLLASEMAHIKKNVLKILGKLARFRQLRRTILSLIINKLGDTDMDVVNQVTKCLKIQFYEDILSGQMLLQETQRFLFRANLSQKAQFYVINFMNNINLRFLNEKTLNRLFQIFYYFFTKFIDNNQDDLSSRLFLNSIKGLNKIFAFLKTSNNQTRKSIQTKLQQIYRALHKTTNIKAKIQLLLFLFQTHIHIHGNLIDRFYRTLYQFLKDPRIIHCSLSEMFFDLVLITIKQDQNVNRMMAMCKRLLQLCFNANSNFIITTLLMLDKIIQNSQGFTAMLFQSQNVMGDNDEDDKIERYDINKRQPKFANAEKTCLWELQTYTNHYHPTVRKFVLSILNQKQIQFGGVNPLLQFNITSFIEKLSLRKQKKSESWRLKVRRNLPKIRKSKYQSLLKKPFEQFNEEQEYIRKYLEKRSKIHAKREPQVDDIQQFADQVVQKQMDRLNPEGMDYGSEMSGFDEIDEEQQEDEGEDDDEGDVDNENIDDEDIGEDQFDQQGQEQDFSQQLDNSEMQYNQNQDSQFQQQQSQSAQKQFEDVFDEIEEEQDENMPKNKNIGRNNMRNTPRNGFRNKPRNSNKNVKTNPRKNKPISKPSYKNNNNKNRHNKKR